jgi:hypothetical protein
LPSLRLFLIFIAVHKLFNLCHILSLVGEGLLISSFQVFPGSGSYSIELIISDVYMGRASMFSYMEFILTMTDVLDPARKKQEFVIISILMFHLIPGKTN